MSITGTSVFKVCDAGTESHGDVEWDDNSFARCDKCGFAAVLEVFRIIPEGEPREYKVAVRITKRYTIVVEAKSPREAVDEAKAIRDDVGVEEGWVRDNDFYEVAYGEDPREVKDADS